jgi:hypothetical protein
MSVLRQHARNVVTRARAGARAALADPGEAAPADPGAGAADGDAPPAGPPLLAWPLDHYYSPVPDNRVLAREPARSRVWPAEPRSMPDLDWRPGEQVALVREQLGRLEPIEFPLASTGHPQDYHADNEMFSRLDAWVLQGMLRQLRPRRMIEVGSGWSSLVTARINRELLGGSMRFTCIEPNPPDFLGADINGISEVVVARVEELPLDPFLELIAGDILFIDSSHTVKTGGDVTFLFQEVLPRLARGVVVQIHDMFWPWDYPEEWVLAGRAWNEQYLVRAFLAFNSAFRILLSVQWLGHHHPEVLAAVLPDYPDAYPDDGGSLWIQRI